MANNNEHLAKPFKNCEHQIKLVNTVTVTDLALFNKQHLSNVLTKINVKLCISLQKGVA